MSDLSWLSRRRIEAEDRILTYLDLADTEWCYGLDMMRSCKLRSGRFYPALRCLTEAGLIEASWEEQPARKHRRRMYRLTQENSDVLDP